MKDSAKYPKNFFRQEYTDIPPVFHSHSTKKPFENCISCNRPLLAPDTQYLVEKAFRHYREFNTTDVIFEYAICLGCAERMRKELSLSSLSRIQEYFDEKVDLHQRREKLMNDSSPDASQWLNECLVTGATADSMDEYQIYGHFMGDRCVFSFMPYMIGGPAVDEITNLLSAKTLGEIDRFIDENFGLPPELKKPIKDHPILLM
uniref:Uncharacterized protein n=1 Tax=Roseihalotalea indica TaxID=2867963 RepID=A0AA49GLT7_9BACT|nr:hypothetical protein K4G66_29615 [Tunicatimonas sp. TK19036]